MTDKEASQIFGMLYELYQRPIERYLMTLVHDKELAADLCHDTFIRVWKHFTRQETTLPQTAYHFKNWLYATAKHIAIDAHRHNELIDFLALLPEAETM